MSRSREAESASLPEDNNPRAAPAMLRRFAGSVDPKFHLTVCDCGVFSINSFDTVEELAEAMKGNTGRDVHMFVHCGFRAGISPGQLPFMLLPDGERVPLFTIPEELEVAADGYVGIPIPITQRESPAATRSQRVVQMRDNPAVTGPATQPATAQTPIWNGEEAPSEESHEE